MINLCYIFFFWSVYDIQYTNNDLKFTNFMVNLSDIRGKLVISLCIGITLWVLILVRNKLSTKLKQ